MTGGDQRISILINPYSGSGRGVKLLQTITEAMDRSPQLKRDIIYAGYTEGKNVSRKIGDLARDSTIIIVCGGDGTFHDAVNVLKSLSYDKYISIFPVGTGNDIGRNLGCFEKDIIRFINRLRTDADEIRFDVFRINGGVYFTNYTSFGHDAFIISSYEKVVRKLMGYRISRLASLKKTILVGTGLYAAVFHNNNVFDKGFNASFTNIILNNLKTYAGGSIFSRLSSFNDGLLELATIRSRMDYLRLILNRFRFFNHIPESSSRKPPLTLSFESDVHVQIDGEDYTGVFKGIREFRIEHGGTINLLI